MSLSSGAEGGASPILIESQHELESRLALKQKKERQQWILEHPLFPLLAHVVKINHFGFLKLIIPDDYYQELATILSEYEGQNVETINTKEFFKNAYKQLYQFAVSHGYKRPRGGSGYEKREMGVEESKMPVESRKASRTDAAIELKEKLKIIEENLTSTEQQVVINFLRGYSLSDICILTGLDRDQARSVFKDSIRKMRAAAGADVEATEAMMPTIPEKGRTLLADKKHGAGDKPVSGIPRVATGDVEGMKLEDIQALFGVSRATAHRIRKRGWYAPGYRKPEHRTQV